MNALSNTLTQNIFPKHLMQHPFSISLLDSFFQFYCSFFRSLLHFFFRIFRYWYWCCWCCSCLNYRWFVVSPSRYRLNIVFLSRSFVLFCKNVYVCVICVVLLYTRIAFDEAEITRLCCVKKTETCENMRMIFEWNPMSFAWFNLYFSVCYVFSICCCHSLFRSFAFFRFSFASLRLIPFELAGSVARPGYSRCDVNTYQSAKTPIGIV